jgi:hypothetical protein
MKVRSMKLLENLFFKSKFTRTKCNKVASMNRDCIKYRWLNTDNDKSQMQLSRSIYKKSHKQ